MAKRALLLLWVVAVVTAEQHDDTSSTEPEHTTAAPTPPIPLRPEYAHPAGVEALDPYNSEKNPPPHRDYLEEDYDHEGHKEDDHDNRDDADELPSLSGDHLLQSSTDDLPMFLLEPQHAYVVRNKPAMLRCRAANALQVYFMCNDVRSVGSTQFEFVDPQSGVRIVEAECNVTRDHLEEYFGEDRFECRCHAWSSRGDIRSQPAVVELAYLKKQFAMSPASTSVEAGSAASLRCSPPPAAPPPRVSWLKHGVPLQQDHNVLISAEGNLLISRATLQDMANYSCVAENIAGKRISESATLTVYVNGGWSAWGAWTQCRCNGRVSGQRRTRTCTEPHPLNGGAPCQGQSVQKTSECVLCQSDGYNMDLQIYDNTQQLLIASPGSGRWGSWTEWSECGSDCRQSRRRACAGDACSGAQVQHADCIGDFCGVHGDIKIQPNKYSHIRYFAALQRLEKCSLKSVTALPNLLVNSLNEAIGNPEPPAYLDHRTFRQQSKFYGPNYTIRLTKGPSLGGRVKKIHKILNSGTVTIWVGSYRLNIDRPKILWCTYVTLT
ncbi:unnamed protein product [Colias eurytheme]|nr:unnamed protein product [Colias eurytheme]